MRKILMFLMLGVAASAVSAPAVFEVNSPQWSKLALQTTDGVNIRKSPSTTAPRLMYNENSITDFDLPLLFYAYWSASSPSGSNYAVTFQGPAPVVSEKDGWVELLGVGPKGAENGWVSGKFCKIATPESISYPAFKNNTYIGWLDRGAEGIYGIESEYNEMEGDIIFRIGRLADGFLVCPYELYCPVVNIEYGLNTGIVKTDDYYCFNINPELLTPEDYCPDMSKLPVKVLEDIVGAADKAKRESVVYCYNSGIFCTNF